MTALLDIDQYISVNKRILRLVGLYPVSLLRYCSCIFFLLLILIPEVFQIYLSRQDSNVILETSSVLLTIVLAILKSIVWLSREETTHLINFLVNDFWDIAIASTEQRNIHKFASSARRVTVSYTILIANALLVFCTLPLTHVMLKRNHNDSLINFPFIATYPQFCYESPFFELVYVSQMLATTVCGLIILGMDTLIATAIFHTSGHFNALCDNFYILNSQLSEPSLRGKLAQLIRHHQITLRFSESMERVFSPMMLLQVLASSVIICLVGFQVNSTLAKRDKLPQYFSYLMMALFQLLLFCWPGDILINESAMVRDAVYSSNWYEAPSRVQADLGFIILRAEKPSFLSAGKFHLMRLENFNAILSTSLSYFMLLRSFDLE